MDSNPSQIILNNFFIKRFDEDEIRKIKEIFRLHVRIAFDSRLLDHLPTANRRYFHNFFHYFFGNIRYTKVCDQPNEKNTTA